MSEQTQDVVKETCSLCGGSGIHMQLMSLDGSANLTPIPMPCYMCSASGKVEPSGPMPAWFGWLIAALIIGAVAALLWAGGVFE